MPVVVVESPAKAKTINKYLGKDYTVLASFGHVRDLPGKSGSVLPDEDFEVKWEVSDGSRKHVQAIANALKDDRELILATDPDREGEAISWHLEAALRGRKAIGADTPVSRVVFNAVTEAAVTEAMRNPRRIDADLVDAYLARRALDYLVGFTLSPVLWRKLPGARSAGRVQSVCLRLVVEREMEIEAFDAEEYWSVSATFSTPRGEAFEARLVSLGETKVERMTIRTEEEANAAVERIRASEFAAASVESKPRARSPSPPFMTSTLQQEASRKLGFGAQATMRAAQRLYEAGHITYMRTDGIDMAPEAVSAARAAIGKLYGDGYVPKSPRMYKNKAKNAQEAHECIRPTELGRHPFDLRLSDADEKRLYELIWQRTIASQMENASLLRTTVEIAARDGGVGMRATGQVVKFDGFLRVYEEGRDDRAGGDEEKRLPQVEEGEALAKEEVGAEQHHTQPPPRFTEATLVKRMEELGIGRPSTYASIMSTLQDREYVRKEKNRLFPEDKGRMVTVFLLEYFRKYVGYEFTADLEEELDDITAGKRAWKDVLGRFWADFKSQVDETSELRVAEVLAALDGALAPRLYPPREDGTDPRQCPKCGEGKLHLKPSRTGGFIGCGNYPDCNYSRSLGGGENGAGGQEGDRLVGTDGDDEIWYLVGRFGPYLQRGREAPADGGKPQRASLPRDADYSGISIEEALKFLSLPREVGEHPEGGVVAAGFGRYGPYVMHKLPDEAKPVYANLQDVREAFDIGMNRAVELLAEKRANPRGRGQSASALLELGERPETGGAVRVLDGRFGPYVKWEKINATVPKDMDPATLTMEQAVELIERKAAKGGGRGRTGKAAGKGKTARTAKAAGKGGAAKTAGKGGARETD